MTITLLRRVTSTRYIFLLSGLVFILWSLATSLLPKSSTLSALFQMDLDQSTTKSVSAQHATDTTTASSSQATSPNSPTTPRPQPQLGGIGIGPAAHTHIYVISLADRQDRREQMGLLRAMQDLTWTVVDAAPKNATLVGRILGWVAHHRAAAQRPPGKIRSRPEFRWPEEINAVSVSRAPWTSSGSDAWVDEAAVPPPGNLGKSSKSGTRAGPTTTYAHGMACAIDDDMVPTFTNGTPPWMVLSPAKIACWHSHISAIRQFVERGGLDDHDHDHGEGEDDVGVFLEDDINMEKDTAARLSHLWPFLPAGWDIVFLGHCWSDESHYPPIAAIEGTTLRPSHHPKCTHAYALSRSGARRLLQHLRHPPFAYSRALDQAYAWLVHSGRLRSYSVVPSLVVQRKSASSDILPGSGSAWRESLRDGVFVV